MTIRMHRGDLPDLSQGRVAVDLRANGLVAAGRRLVTSSRAAQTAAGQDQPCGTDQCRRRHCAS